MMDRPTADLTLQCYPGPSEVLFSNGDYRNQWIRRIGGT
jgi:hypothetical protein